MPKDAGFKKRDRIGWKVLLGCGLVGPMVAGVAMVPSAASSEGGTGTHGHAAHAAGPEDELARVRAATARFHRVEEAMDAGYELGWVNGSGNTIVDRCISHPTLGAMGYHYFNADLMADNDVDALEPEVLVYAPAPNGGLKLVAVEWVVLGPESNPPGVSEAPAVLGMPMHILLRPPAGPGFYLRHAWVWANNPAGMFADWNPEVSCS